MSASKKRQSGRQEERGFEIDKCKAVIKSCTTTDQLAVAAIYVSLLGKKHIQESRTVKDRLDISYQFVCFAFLVDMQKMLLENQIDPSKFWNLTEQLVE